MIEDMHADTPKSLGSPDVRARRVAAIEQEHVAPLSAFVRSLREEMGAGYCIPYFDPMDGGIHADCLFLLEAPGGKARDSGFFSRDNPDETAKNFFQLNRNAGIERKRAVIWNVVPWYIGSDTRIRPANIRDLAAAKLALERLVAVLPALHTVVLVGQKAASARSLIGALLPSARIYSIPHPSLMFVNRSPTNGPRILDGLRAVARGLPGPTAERYQASGSVAQS